ncbi:calcineurin-like phosphoesterase [Psychrobacter sp. JCM 18903]|nr:calcineurin-like phosphoesterase [Psychrobacter sp. JCM 18903]
MMIDVIGDIHGYADKLIGLLEQLGYVHNARTLYRQQGIERYLSVT